MTCVIVSNGIINHQYHLNYVHPERFTMWKITKDDNNKLLKIKISDKLNLDELSDILKAIYTENDGKNSNYNRFADLTDLEDIEIDFDRACSRINEYRCLIQPNRPIKISLFIPQKYITGFSHLYKSMSGGDMFQVEISESLDECAKYLSVDKKVLQNEII